MFLWRERLLFFYPPDGGYNNVIPPGFKTSFACLSALEPALSIAKRRKKLHKFSGIL
jgi:hypothetical protein